MTVTVAVRFPLGRYHATAWDRSVNEGAVEWPPSPWRLLRALVATWYNRWPELPAPVLDGLLEALGDPPVYRTLPARPAHTRHYLPDAEHRKGDTGNTDLTLDPYLSVPPNRPLLVQWEAQLTDEQRSALAKLLELMPYLGRADAICAAALHDSDPEPDDTWWRPMPPTGDEETVRLLTPDRPIRRPILELSTMEVRRARRTMPPQTRWITYTRRRTTPVRPPVARRAAPEVTAVRFAVVSPAAFRATHGVLLADEVHRQAARRLANDRPDLLGTNGAATNHRHAHWLPLPTDGDVTSFVVWAPDKLSTEEIAQIIAVRRVSGRRGDDYQLAGFPERVELLLQGVGRIDQVAPELCGPARRWRSLTPYLPVRHRKRESLDDFLAADVRRELGYRPGLPTDATVTRVHPDDGMPDQWARRYRRYRATERLAHSRPGLGLRLEFAREVTEPVALGQLSHFGFGLFVPDKDPP